MTDDDDPMTVQDDEGGSLEDRETISRPSPRLHQEVEVSLDPDLHEFQQNQRGDGRERDGERPVQHLFHRQPSTLQPDERT